MSSATEGSRKELLLSPPQSLFFVIFTISGFSGLIYESIWSHYLKLFLGHAAYAQSLVLAIFMGGMAIGSWVASRISSRSKKPFLIYAGAEALIGVAALVFHPLFAGMMDAFYTSVLPGIDAPVIAALAKWTVASLIILPQSILLGMTFPLMAAAFIRRFPGAPGASISMLYFTNSIGAAIGVLASGFWLIGAVGLPGTILSAGLINIALATVVWVLVRLDPEREASFRAEEETADSGPPLTQLFLIAALITGTASFIYEISWIRMLSLVLGSTTHSFELMLSAFITGLAFGGLWIRRRIDHISDPVRFSGVVQIVMGVLAVATIPIYGQSFEWMSQLMSGLARNEPGYNLFVFASHGIALAVMLPTTFFAGMTLPLFTAVLLRRGQGEKSIGRIYAANTLGAIVGVLFTVHIGLPALGLENSILVAAMLDVTLGVVLLARSGAGWRTARDLPIGLVGVGAVIAVASMSGLDQRQMASGVYRVGVAALGDDIETLYYRDGKTASVSLHRAPNGMVGISTNGKTDASIQMVSGEAFSNDEVTMVLAAALPLAYHENPRQVANIGFGSGMTTHSLLADRRPETVDTVEIERSIIEAARLFGPFVERAYTDERSKIHIEDAKTFFSHTNNLYDVIIAEPSNPWVSGVASLFSAEFYKTIKNYVAEDGLFVQWLQLYEFNDKLMLSVLKALDANFSDYAVYFSDDENVLIVSSPHRPLPEPDWKALYANGISAELVRLRIERPDDILVRKLLTKRSIQPFLATSSTPANSDYFPYVDLHAGQARFSGEFSTLLQDWSNDHLPLLEMLDNSELDFSKVQPVPYAKRVGQIDVASAVHRRLFDKEVAGAAGALPAKLETAIARLNNREDPCRNSEPFDVWLEDTHEIATATLAFLNRREALEVIGVVAPDECVFAGPIDNGELRGRWLDLYRAVAGRDGQALTLAGSVLVASEMNVSPERLTYAINATLLGYVTIREPGGAMALLEKFGRQVFLRGSAGPAGYRLLRSIVYAEHLAQTGS